MLVIDPQHGSAPALLEDSRLGGAYRVYAGTDGNAYVAGSVSGDTRLFGSALGGAPLPESGLLRINAGQGPRNALDSIHASDERPRIRFIDDHAARRRTAQPSASRTLPACANGIQRRVILVVRTLPSRVIVAESDRATRDLALHQRFCAGICDEIAHCVATARSLSGAEFQIVIASYVQRGKSSADKVRQL